MPEVLPSPITQFFLSGLAIDVALGVIALEFLVLMALGKSEKIRSLVVTLILALGPGACLMLALRAALTQAGIFWVALFLLLSLPLHLADLARRKI